MAICSCKNNAEISGLTFYSLWLFSSIYRLICRGKKPMDRLRPVVSFGVIVISPLPGFIFLFFITKYDLSFMDYFILFAMLY